jgi:hypothetical protein
MMSLNHQDYLFLISLTDDKCSTDYKSRIFSDTTTIDSGNPFTLEKLKWRQELDTFTKNYFESFTKEKL